MKYHKNPFIFLPGLMGSYGGEMVGSDRQWSFGAARIVYDPVIRGIEQLGYRRNQNLFICYYDWRMSLETIADNFLIPLIKEINQRFPDQPIDIMAHSMGGLVARSYVQSKSYFKKVDKLILVGTPNEGNVEAYYFWSTGNLTPKERKSFFQLLHRGYVWMLRKVLKLPSGPENLLVLRENFPGLRDLLPARGYGPFLTYENTYGEKIFLPNEYARYQNDTLNRMNRSLHLLKQRVNRLCYYAGEGFETSEGLLVGQEGYYQRQEQIDKVLKTLQGDGTVVVRSAVLPKVNGKLLNRNHSQLMTDAVQDLAIEYHVKESREIKEVGETLHLIFRAGTDFILRQGNTEIFEYRKGGILSIYPYLLEGDARGYQWLILQDLPEDEYSVFVNSTAQQGVSMLLLADQLDQEVDQPVHRLSREPVATFYFHRT